MYNKCKTHYLILIQKHISRIYDHTSVAQLILEKNAKCIETPSQVATFKHLTLTFEKRTHIHVIIFYKLSFLQNIVQQHPTHVQIVVGSIPSPRLATINTTLIVTTPRTELSGSYEKFSGRSDGRTVRKRLIFKTVSPQGFHQFNISN